MESRGSLVFQHLKGKKRNTNCNIDNGGLLSWKRLHWLLLSLLLLILNLQPIAVHNLESADTESTMYITTQASFIFLS